MGLEVLAQKKLPLDERLKALQAELNAISDENEWKEKKLSLEFCQSQLDKINDEINSLTEKNKHLQNEIVEIEKQIQILDCIIDFKVLTNREINNFENRCGRTRERNLKTISERDALIHLRENLNTRWRDLTGDADDLCPELCLMANSELFFI